MSSLHPGSPQSELRRPSPARAIREPALARMLGRSDTVTPFYGRVNRKEVRRREQGRSLKPTTPALDRSLSSGVVVLDREFCIVRCNAVVKEHFGVIEGRDIGRPVTRVIQQPLLVAYIAAKDFSRPLLMQANDCDSGGATLSVRLVPFIESQWLLLSDDVTEALKAEIMRCDGIANALHEMGTPLTLLMGYLEALREFASQDQAREYLDLMGRQCDRVRLITKDMLRLSTLEAASEPPSEARVDVRKLLNRIHAEAEALSGGRHRIVLDAEAEFDLAGTECEIASVFGNLASNAVRYTPPGGEVRLIWRASLKGAEFAVEDTGIGIEKQHLSRLTERFYRVDPARSRAMGGTGLGLSIVKQALTRHQAELKIESKPGKGSRFAALFPASRILQAQIAQHAAA